MKKIVRSDNFVLTYIDDNGEEKQCKVDKISFEIKISLREKIKSLLDKNKIDLRKTIKGSLLIAFIKICCIDCKKVKRCEYKCWNAAKYISKLFVGQKCNNPTGCAATNGCKHGKK